MTYEKTQLLYQSSFDLVLEFCEIDEARWEVRKVEVFADGSMTWADESTPLDAKTRLSDQRTPKMEHMKPDPELITELITPEAFEEIWRAARSGEKWK